MIESFSKRSLTPFMVVGGNALSGKLGIEPKLNGFPDFGSILNPDKGSVVFIKYRGTRSKDFTAANRERIMMGGEKEKGRRGGQPSNYTWHHNETMGIMELIQTYPHGKISHYGGVYYYKLINPRLSGRY